MFFKKSNNSLEAGQELTPAQRDETTPLVNNAESKHISVRKKAFFTCSLLLGIIAIDSTLVVAGSIGAEDELTPTTFFGGVGGLLLCELICFPFVALCAHGRRGSYYESRSESRYRAEVNAKYFGGNKPVG